MKSFDSFDSTQDKSAQDRPLDFARDRQREKPAAKILWIFLYFILLYGILLNAMSIKYKSGIIY